MDIAPQRQTARAKLSRLRQAANHGTVSVRTVIGCVASIILVVIVYSVPIRHAIQYSQLMFLRRASKGIWVAISGEIESRQRSGYSSLWPADIGFSQTNTSTEYFQLMLSSATVIPYTRSCAVATSSMERLVSDLSPEMLGGIGVSITKSAESFGAANNAWNVICVSTSSPPDTPFLVSRNVRVGHTLSATSSITKCQSRLKTGECVLWITKGGDINARRFTDGEHLWTNVIGNYDVMYP